MAGTARAAARPKARPGPRPRARSVPRRAAGIRWDRVARTMLLVALVMVVLSFLGPATKYVRTWQLARETRGDVRQLRDDNARLRHEAKLLKDPQQIELRARQLGMARPGERVYVVHGLPRAEGK